MNWFKVYTEARNDAKLRSLTDAQHRVWFNLLCFAAEQPVRGTICCPSLTILAIEVSGGDRGVIVDTLTALLFLNCITVSPCNALVTPCNAQPPVTGVTEALQPVTIVFKSFEKRQHIKPSDEKERIRQRVAKHRSLKGYKRDVVPDVTGNAPVTPCNAPLARDSDSDSEREDDLIPLPPSEPGSQPKQRYDPKDCLAYPGPDDLYDVESGPNAMEPDEARKIFRSLWHMFGVHEICTDFYVRQNSYTHEVWVAAILQADRARSPVMSLRYVETIAQKYALKGIPKESPIASLNGQPSPPRRATVGEARVQKVKDQARRMKEKHGVKHDG